MQITLMFQFHTGSIKREILKGDEDDPYKSFNSILVRLKVTDKVTLHITSDTVSIPYWFD